MKSLHIFIALLFFNQVVSQVDAPSSPIDFIFNESFQSTESKSASYTKALIWIAESFGDANEVIKLKDKEEGIIVVKGITNLNGFNTGFTMTLLFEEDSLNISLKNFEETNYGYNTRNWGVKPNACYTKMCKKNYSKWYSSLENIVDSLKTSLLSSF